MKQRESIETHGGGGLRRRLTNRDGSSDAASGSDSGSSSSGSSSRSTPSMKKFARAIMDVLKDRKKTRGIYPKDLRKEVFDELNVKGSSDAKDAFDEALETLDKKEALKIGKHRVKLILSGDHTDQSKTGERSGSSSSGGDGDRSSGGEENRVFGGNEEVVGDDQSIDFVEDEDGGEDNEAENRIEDDNTDITDPPMGENEGGADSDTNDNQGTGDGDGEDAGVDSGANESDGIGEGNREGDGSNISDGSTGTSDATDNLTGKIEDDGSDDTNIFLPDGSETEVEDDGMFSNGDLCQLDEECLSGACVMGTCSSPRLEGDTCDSDRDCLSGACGSTSLSPGSPKICCAARLQDVCTGQENGAICIITSVARQSSPDDILLNGICASGFCSKDGFCDDKKDGETEDPDSNQDSSGTDGEAEEVGVGEETVPETGDNEEDIASKSSEGGRSCNTGCKVGASIGAVAAVGAIAAAVAATKRKKNDGED